MVRVWVRVMVRVRLGDAVVRNAVGRNVGNRSEVEACLVNLVILIKILYINIQQDTRAGLPQFLGWPEVLISFSLTLSHSVPRHYTSCRGLVLRARECVSPAKAVPIRSLVTGRLLQAGIEPPTLCAGNEREATTPHS